MKNVFQFVGLCAFALAGYLVGVSKSPECVDIAPIDNDIGFNYVLQSSNVEDVQSLTTYEVAPFNGGQLATVTVFGSKRPHITLHSNKEKQTLYENSDTDRFDSLENYEPIRLYLEGTEFDIHVRSYWIERTI